MAKASSKVHVVSQAVAILRELQPITGAGRYAFPNPLTHDWPPSDNGVLPPAQIGLRPRRGQRPRLPRDRAHDSG